MFDSLSDKLTDTIKRIRGQGKINEKNIHETLREVKLNLLEADVHFRVVKNFINRVKERATGRDVLKSITPGQQFIKIVYEELAEIMGGENKEINLNCQPPAIILLVGLQGCGKTTTAAKLAKRLKEKNNRNPLLVPADIYRPAAIDQLKILGQQVGCSVYDTQLEQKPVDIACSARKKALNEGYDTMIIDTAGRLHIDQVLMNELVSIREEVNPSEILFIADAMTGQDAVNVAKRFNDLLDIDGVILTKMDGDARGGAALSIVEITGKPIKLAGVGEQLDALELFHPDRAASRILDMGDVLTLVEKAKEVYDEDQAQLLEKKLRQNNFTLDDFLLSLRQMKKMGSIEDLLKMIPGVGKQMKQLKKINPPEKEVKRIEAIINSMTREERQNHAILNGSRRKRIAQGSGTRVQDVNQFIKHYIETRKVLKRFNKFGMRGLMRNFM